ncbi:MAG: sugar phosphate isomerase/epimerase [Spirochaetes bacterium]|nr:sugar phosphate isomerase/epimerase [Spirochaetota bacterium]
MRLGGPLFAKYADPESWAREVITLGYRAAYCPVGPEASDAETAQYEAAAKQAGIIIAECGAWSNPISQDEHERKNAVDKCVTMLAHADRIGARCCVNIAGARGKMWDGPHPDNLSGETFDMIVSSVRSIVDAVKPARAFYTLETMPWIFPDSAESYLRLIKAINRKQFAVHFDPVNIVNCPERYFDTGTMLRECFRKLGRYIKSCHAKDTLIEEKLTLHINEVRPGLGVLDYRVYLSELNKLGDIPLMLEHLPNADDYRLAADHIRGIAKDEGIVL